MGKINSRAKGASAERELIRLLCPLLGFVVEDRQLKRNLEQTRLGGHDIVGLDAWALEVKRYASATESDVNRWWGQATEQANRVGKAPALAYKLDYRSWRFRIPLAHLRPDLPGDAKDHVEWTIELGVDAFASIVRETIESPQPETSNNGNETD